MNPLISVVIPTYNHAHFLRFALQSVIEQTYQNWEIIIIDNHSSDNTDEVLKQFDFYNLRIFKINNNGIIGVSRNVGIKAAKGDWIAFLDSDDIWYKEKLKKSVDAILDNPNINVICTDELMVNKVTREEQILHHGPYCADFYRTLLISGNRLSTSATMVKKSFLEKTGILFRENSEFVTAEDYDFWLQLAYANSGFLFISSIQGEYIIHSTNQSGQFIKHFISVEAVLKNHVFSIQSFTDNKQKLWSFVYSRFLINSGIHFLRQSNYVTGIKIICSSFIKQPMGTLSYIGSQIQKTQPFNK
jgi:glycosyltransferase involved in cell wall biosynthesis